MEQKFKRRNFFINKSFQGRYIFQFYFLIILGALIFSILFSYLSAQTLTVTYDNYNLKIDSTPFMLFKQMVTTNWIIFIPIGVIVIIVGLFQTHRIAGPLFKLEGIFERMTEGHIETDSWLRTKDDGKELFDKLNKFNLFLAHQVDNMNEQSHALTKQLNEVEKHVEGMQQKEHVKQAIEEMRLIIGKLDSTLDVFQIKR